jgi:hypothetical protein
MVMVEWWSEHKDVRMGKGQGGDGDPRGAVIRGGQLLIP